MFSIIWFPYIYFIVKYFSKVGSRAKAASIIIIFALLGYRLPIPGAFNIPMHFIGTGTLIIFILLEGSNKNFSLRGDKPLLGMVLMYTVIHFISVLFNYEESVTLPTYIIRLYGYFPLFFICLLSINTRRDINILCNGIMIAGILMAIIGIGQFYYNDSLWGIQSTRKIHDIYGEHFTESINIGYGSMMGFRVASSASNPNSFSAVMCMTLALSLYNLKTSRSRIYNMLIQIGMCIQLVGLILSGSRAGIITLFLLSLVYIILLMHKKNNTIKIIKTVSVYALVSIIIISGLLSNDYYKKEILSRYSTIIATSDGGFIQTSNRLNRAWIPYIMRIRPEMFVIGYGTPGIPSEEDREQMSRTTHNDFLGVLYFNGFWGLFAFIGIILRYFKTTYLMHNYELRNTLILCMLAYLIFGISAESFIHKGQPYIFWPLLAIAARFKIINSNKLLKNVNKVEI